MAGRARRRTSSWTGLNDEDLLDLRMCDLPLALEGTALERWVGALYDDLDRRGMRFRPRVWISDEWFTPPEAPGIALPFYLASPRLRQLERRRMLAIEGGTRREAMRLLRHECGHAIQFAYGLHRRRRWRELFGSSSQPYPDAYRPEPYSREYVLHLDNHYAQAHPDEDFAETFAVWLSPSNHWRKRYAGWPALAKLEYVDELMGDIATAAPRVASRRRIRALASLRHTLREHYRRRQRRYGILDPDVYNRDLRRLFVAGRRGDRRPAAAAMLRRWRRDLLESVARWTGLHSYTIDGIYTEMIERCRALELRLPDDEDEDAVKREAAVLLAVQAMNHVQLEGQWISV